MLLKALDLKLKEKKKEVDESQKNENIMELDT